VSRISKADRQLQLQREEAGDHLYANRVRVYPKSVHGPVRRFKWAVLIVCLSIYYLLPWLRWHRGVNQPDQAVTDCTRRHRIVSEERHPLNPLAIILLSSNVRTESPSRPFRA